MGALSNGCNTCKRRKVKCDEIRPKCARCSKAGVECTGFTTRLRFVDENTRTIRRTTRDTHEKSSKLSIATTSPAVVLELCRVERSQPHNAALFLADTLPLTAFKNTLFISYLCSKLFGQAGGRNPRRRYSYNTLQCGMPTDWLDQTSSTLRPKSWDALAALVFGQAHNSREAKLSALALYGEALRELHERLSDPEDQRSNSMVASMTALYTYEILLSKSEKRWLSHVDGIGWIVEWRGPWVQKSRTGKGILLEHRIMLVAKSIMSRQRTFLRHPLWKTVPWEDDPSSKSEVDYLVDIGTDIAEYTFLFEKLEGGKDDAEIERFRLRGQVAASLEDLNTWWRQWEAKHTHTVQEMPSHTLNRDTPFPSLLEYETLWDAFTICIHNTMRILLLQLWERISHSSDPIKPSSQVPLLNEANATVLLGITPDIKGLAREILRSLTCSYSKSRCFIYTFSFLFIQDTTYGCFENGEREAIWIARHGWAELNGRWDVEDANLLRGLLPLDRPTLGKDR